MNASIRRTAAIAVAAAGILAANLALAQQPQQPTTFRGRITPAPSASTSADACPDTMRAALQPNRAGAFNVAAAQPIIVVPQSAFAPGQFTSQVRNATTHAQLARACAS